MASNSSSIFPRYSDRDYWENRYRTEEEREWLCNYDTISHYIRNLVKPTDKILVIGCGNSPFSFDMVNDGYQNLISIDYASSVIENMKMKYPTLTWVQMDMMDMKFDSNSFNVVIEKATLDAILVEERDQWNISGKGGEKLEGALKEIHRVLISNGVFISVSFAQPHFRIPLYARAHYEWSIELETVGEYFHHFVYTMTKGNPVNPSIIEKYERIHTPATAQHPQRCLSMKDDEDFLRNISVGD